MPRIVLVAFLACVLTTCALAQSPLQQQRGESDPQRSSPGLTVPATPARQVPVAAPQPAGSDDQRSNANQWVDRLWNLTRGIEWANWALFIAALWAGRIALRTLRAQVTQIKIGRSAMDASRKAADAAARSADVAHKALLLDSAVSMGIGDLRVSLIDDRAAGETRIQVSYRLYNASKNPAHVQRFNASADLSGGNGSALLDYPIHETFAPGKGIHFPIQTSPLDSAQLLEWNTNTLTVRVLMVITTSDPQGTVATHRFQRYVTCGPEEATSRLLQGERERD
jgi:hypothetical protein